MVYTYLLVMLVLLVPLASGHIRIPIQRKVKTGLPTAQKKVFRTQDTTVSLVNSYTTEYSAIVNVGTPGQEFNVIFDTGSSDVWFFSDESFQIYDGLSYYSSNASSTYQPIGQAWSIVYGSGSCEGFLSSDLVEVGDLSARQTFAEVTIFSSNFADQDLSGIMGMGFQELAASGAATYMDNLLTEGVIENRLFSFYLTSDVDEALNDGSVLIIGEPDLTYAPHGVTYIDVVEDNAGYWMVAMGPLTVDGGFVTGLCDTYLCTTIIDTGTSLIGLPMSAGEAFMNAVIDRRSDCYYDTTVELYICTDTDTNKLPIISFTMGGVPFNLKPEQYILLSETADGELVSVLCFTILTMDVFILGDTFLKEFYSIYDMENKVIGLANGPELLHLTWPRALGIIAVVTFVLAGGLLYIYLKHKRQDAAPGGGYVGVGMLDGGGGGGGGQRLGRLN